MEREIIPWLAAVVRKRRFRRRVWRKKGLACYSCKRKKIWKKVWLAAACSCKKKKFGRRVYLPKENTGMKSHVYSFGVVLLQLTTGKPAIVRISASERRSLNDCAIPIAVGGDARDVIDPNLKGNHDIKTIQKVAEIARACTSPKSVDRPHMRDVVVELEYIGNEKALESGPESGGCIDSGPNPGISEFHHFRIPNFSKGFQDSGISGRLTETPGSVAD
ncbi:putative leucine-rich repeat receptor-like protein kinase isoform X1 [Cinnamomum micranthum f. kanehirae]|uniref:Putative leucine-rich repeat receptor-like protein kinase isoform X1 n=1 Tax=Cinnamomum micranthum f. kanehirae TaxID=337451 RepID=A0A3S3M6V8_9MAGN|nr:putative leucine-rich repeat receptor-like protein kinase isoform X1 [Cinnamomum micranthum f. kanehirae]